jgi:DNA-dependent RNA polymerase auxiliary subunit epsilon
LNLDRLAGEVDIAYAALKAARREAALAAHALAESETRVRQNNAEALLSAKNERTASLYLEGMLDTEGHRDLVERKLAAELALDEARLEVERLQLLARFATALGDGGA